MELLDKLVLPQSSEHITLLHFMSMLVFFLFIPFIGAIFGGTFLSLSFHRKARKTSNPLYERFAKECIEIVTINKSSGVILGIVPLLAAVMMFAQILHKSDAATVGLLLMSFVLTTTALILIYSYRYSLGFKEIFEVVDNDALNKKDISENFNKLRSGTIRMSLKAGKWGLLFLFLGLWFFTSALTQVFYPEKWGTGNIFYLLFSAESLIRFSYVILASFAISGAAILFAFFYWEGGRKMVSEEYSTLVRNAGVKTALTSSIILPVVIFLNFFLLPQNSLSVSIFVATLIGIILIFLACNYLYILSKENRLAYSGYVFFSVLFALMAFVVKDQLAMSNSTKQHSAVLAHDFELFLAELKGDSEGAGVMTGAEIFETRCASCHKFDEKLVGPSYKEVLPKYDGKLNQLVAFIRNPVKVDPAYPPMPNPGLKPAEAEAIATYLLEEFKTRQ